MGKVIVDEYHYGVSVITNEERERINKFLEQPIEKQIEYYNSLNGKKAKANADIEVIRKGIYPEHPEHADHMVKDFLESLKPEEIQVYKEAMGEEEFNRVMNLHEGSNE
jgi:hypothetical protein